MHIAAAVAGQQDMAVGHLDVAHRLLADILVHLFLDGHADLARRSVRHVDAQTILMTVHGIDSHLFCVTGHDDAGNIAVLVQRHL